LELLICTILIYLIFFYWDYLNINLDFLQERKMKDSNEDVKKQKEDDKIKKKKYILPKIKIKKLG